ncbi:transglutaminase-like domain-containing protein, partial [Faucicola boevrei]|uniref:transglutaminase-like domain-containing protein n=1 Tax=Faucicola boevrei TaxID=346665 RepID=UPI0003825391
MSIFFNNNKNEQKATWLTKSVSLLCTSAMLNVLVLPATLAKAQEAPQQQSIVGENAYEQLVNLNTQYQLQTQDYQQTQTKKRTGRSIYQKAKDGIISLFTNNSETINYDPTQLQNTIDRLEHLKQQLADEQNRLMAELAQQKTTLQNSNNQTALTEHEELTQEAQNRYQTLQNLIENALQAPTSGQQYQALQALSKQLEAWQPVKRQTDMENLPWGTPNNKVREPIVKENTNAIAPATFKQKITAVEQWRQTEYQIGQYLLNQQHKNGIIPINQLSGQSQAGEWAVLKSLPAQVSEADLGETDDVQISQAIKDKAKELDHNPTKIYKWVHDNIEFVPSYGSIQGSDYTLQTMRGNATDTASLLIALLRASKIPARYVYGTVDIPAKQAMDWVGGVNNIDAAQNLLGQGGVPNTALMSGSEAKYLRLEHTWVEANVTNLPAKGSINNLANNQGNMWIPLDASYKSYIRTKGIDLAKAVPFDAQKLIDQAKQGATINETTGAVSNLNQNAVNTAIQDYQKQVETYLKQHHPDATVGDVLGTDTIKPYKSQFLSPVLPYKIKTVIGDYHTLPDNMKHYFEMQLFESTDTGLFGFNRYLDENSPIATVKLPTTKLQGKPLSLSFKPANESDEKNLLNYLPKDENGTLPSYLPTNINMTPELSLDGEVLLSKGSYKLGSEVKLKYGFNSPNSDLPSLVNKDVTAGEYHAIGYNLQGMSQQQLEKTKKTLEDTKAKLEKFQATKDQTALAGLTKHDLTGAIMQAGVQSYFAVLQAQDVIAQKQAGIITNPYMSIGTFGTGLSTQYRYGIAINTKPKGVIMDIDRILKQTVDKDNVRAKVTAYNRATGPSMSLNENLIPEQLFDDPNTTEKEAQGISAVKALQIASSQGQTIYTVTKANYSEILPKLNHSTDVMTDVRNAINAGKEVTISQKQINAFGWSGTGYIVLDPESGVGAYMIGGGADGGILPMIGGLGVGILFSIILASFGAAVTAGGSLILLALAAIVLAITAYYLWSNYTDDQRQCFWQGFDTGAILGGAGAASLVKRVSNALYTAQEAALVARAQNIGAG